MLCIFPILETIIENPSFQDGGVKMVAIIFLIGILILISAKIYSYSNILSNAYARGQCHNDDNSVI